MVSLLALLLLLGDGRGSEGGLGPRSCCGGMLLMLRVCRKLRRYGDGNGASCGGGGTNMDDVFVSPELCCGGSGPDGGGGMTNVEDVVVFVSPEFDAVK